MAGDSKITEDGVGGEIDPQPKADSSKGFWSSVGDAFTFNSQEEAKSFFSGSKTPATSSNTSAPTAPSEELTPEQQQQAIIDLVQKIADSEGQVDAETALTFLGTAQKIPEVLGALEQALAQKLGAGATPEGLKNALVDTFGNMNVAITNYTGTDADIIAAKAGAQEITDSYIAGIEESYAGADAAANPAADSDGATTTTTVAPGEAWDDETLKSLILENIEVIKASVQTLQENLHTDKDKATEALQNIVDLIAAEKGETADPVKLDADGKTTIDVLADTFHTYTGFDSERAKEILNNYGPILLGLKPEKADGQKNGGTENENASGGIGFFALMMAIMGAGSPNGAVKAATDFVGKNPSIVGSFGPLLKEMPENALSSIVKAIYSFASTIGLTKLFNKSSSTPDKKADFDANKDVTVDKSAENVITTAHNTPDNTMKQPNT